MTSVAVSNPNLVLSKVQTHTSRMGNNRTPNTCNITTQERHSRLLQSVVRLLWLPKRLINLLHRLLKRRKLHHGIRNLTTPKWIQSLIKSRIPLFRNNLRESLPQIMRIRRQRCLHAHLDRLPRTQRYIRQELGRRRRGKIYHCLVHPGRQLIAIQVLEDFVEAVFASALERVADKSWGPAKEDAAEAFFAEDHAPGLRVGFVELVVDLAAAFYEVERGHHCVCWAAGCYGFRISNRVVLQSRCC